MSRNIDEKAFKPELSSQRLVGMKRAAKLAILISLLLVVIVVSLFKFQNVILQKVGSNSI